MLPNCAFSQAQNVSRSMTAGFILKFARKSGEVTEKPEVVVNSILFGLT